MTTWFNKLSAEDTFITYSGEQLTLKDEASYLGSLLAQMQVGDAVSIVAEAEGEIIGKCDITRVTKVKQRSLHVGHLAISLDSQFRGDGIGSSLLDAAIEQAKQRISGLKMIVLEVFSTNTGAQAVYSKAGFKECGRIPGKILHKGEFIDEIWMYMNL